MPCSDGRRDDQCQEAEARAHDTQRRLDAIVDLLCQWGRAHDRGEPMPPTVRAFLDEHKRWDAKRGQPWC